jgi:hypothetical protein
MRRRLIALVLGLSPWIAASVAAAPISGAITYQGELRDGAGLYAGTADFRVTLYPQAEGGSPVGLPNTLGNITVVGGRFTLPNLDFGPAGFTTGEARWMAIEVRTPSDPTNTGPFTLLTPRQPVTAAPAAVMALSALSAQAAVSASLLNGVPPSFFQNAANLNSGTIPSARLAGAYTGALTLSNAANAFTGSGAGLTALNAGALSSGTIPDSRLSANILRLDGASATISGGPLNLILPGTTTGGNPGFPEVVLNARNTVAGQHSAITIDGKPGFDGILYLGENGVPIWGVRSDSSANKEFQVRLHNGGNTTMLSMTTAGNMGLGTAPTTDRLTVGGNQSVTGNLSVGGSLALNQGLAFPDGSVQYSAVVSAPAVNANFVNDSFDLTWNGDRVTLESPIIIGVDVQEQEPINLNGTRVTPGQVYIGAVTISRIVPTGSSTWVTFWTGTTVANHATRGRNLVLTRTAFSPVASARSHCPTWPPRRSMCSARPLANCASISNWSASGACPPCRSTAAQLCPGPPSPAPPA